MKQKIKISILFLLTAFIFGCTNNEQCREERYVAMGVELIQNKFDNNAETYVSSKFTPDSITVYGVGNDSILYLKKQTSTLKLPLQKTTNKSKFVFFTNGTYDTLTVLHKNINNYLSMECGCVVFANITSVSTTTHKIDSAVIRIPRVINKSEKNLQVYFKTE